MPRLIGGLRIFARGQGTPDAARASAVRGAQFSPPAMARKAVICGDDGAAAAVRAPTAVRIPSSVVGARLFFVAVAACAVAAWVAYAVHTAALTLAFLSWGP